MNMAKITRETVGEDTVCVVSLSEREYTLALEISDKFHLAATGDSVAKRITGTLEKAADFVGGMSGSMFLNLQPAAQTAESPKTKSFVITDKCAADLENLSTAFNLGLRETVGATLEMYRLMSPASKSGGKKLAQSGALFIVE